MSKVDWSKAPEGFPIWVEDLNRDKNFDQSGWHADRGDRYEDQSGNYWLKSDDHAFRVHERPAAPQWNGEGLPPVGDSVEWFSPVYGWLGGRVVGHDGTVAVISHNDGYTGCHPHEVRPIRTPEQLAAEAREKAINEMRHIAEHDAHSRAVDYGALYDAGYRKQEQPE